MEQSYFWQIILKTNQTSHFLISLTGSYKKCSCFPFYFHFKCELLISSKNGLPLTFLGSKYDPLSALQHPIGTLFCSSPVAQSLAPVLLSFQCYVSSKRCQHALASQSKFQLSVLPGLFLYSCSLTVFQFPLF